MTSPINPQGAAVHPPSGVGVPPSPWAPAGRSGGQTPPASIPAPDFRSPDPRRGGQSWRRRTVIAAVIAATALGGGAVGALLTGLIQHSAEPTVAASSPTAETVHAQDVKLCTAYAIINSATPKPDNKGIDLLPGATALQVAVDANPDASPEVRTAMTQVIDVFYARMASYAPVRIRGLAEPPGYDQGAAQAAYDRAWQVCELGK